jgi:sodium/pantothenate symporter
MPTCDNLVLKNARREAWIIASVWLAATVCVAPRIIFMDRSAPADRLGLGTFIPSSASLPGSCTAYCCRGGSAESSRSGSPALSWPMTISEWTRQTETLSTIPIGTLMLDDPLNGHWAPVAALAIFTLVSLGLGVVANQVATKNSAFLKRYFLGNRSMGAVAVALTAAVMSGGTFVGVPATIYRYGWVGGLWISSYMVVPLTILGIMGKRIGQLSRRTGAITLPDLFRERYRSPALGLVTSLLVMFFLTVFLVAQFKAGAVIVKIVLPGQATNWLTPESAPAGGDPAYLIGLVIFTATVVAYTAYGGFLAAIWTDVFQSLIMAIGVLILLPLALIRSGGLEAATLAGMKEAGDAFAFGPGAGREFLPIGLAFSFFVMWAITGMGQPSTMVRLMAFRDSRTLRYSIIYQSLYNALIYIPLIFIFIAARSILPPISKPDEVMPSLVITLANPYLAGFILAAPYGAVMSTVSGFLLIISSGLVRDLYQRFLRPDASEKEIARASYTGTVLVGVLVAGLAIRPPAFLQTIIVFASAGMASAFLVPALMAAFWRRATAAGALSAMIGGTSTTVGLYILGYSEGWQRLLSPLIGPPPDIGYPAPHPFFLLNMDPCVWGLAASFAAGVVVSLATSAPPADHISNLFDAEPIPDRAAIGATEC